MDADDPAPLRAMPLWRRALRWTVLGVLALALLAALLVAGLNTAPGRNFAARQISGMSFANGLRVGVGRIDGSLYGKARLIDLVAYDTRGVFLHAPVVELDWRPLAYLNSHVDLRSVHSATVSLLRKPVFRPSAPDAPLLPDIDIDVGQLTIDRLVAEAAVSGERRELKLTGSAKIADRRAQVRAQAITLAAAGGNAGDRLDLVLDAVPEANRLALRLSLDAPRGGVLAALVGLTQPLALRLDGKGDWAQWQGRLNATLAARQVASLDLTARNGNFTVKGPAELGAVLGGTAAMLFDATTRVDLAARLDGRRAALSGSLRSDALSLAPGGVVDLGESSFDGFKLDFVLLRPAVLAPNLSGRALRANLEFQGSFVLPEVQYGMTAEALAMNDIALEGLVASGKARVDTDKVLIPVSARVSRIAGLDSAAGGTLTQVELDGDLAVQGTRILSDNMRIRSSRIDAKAILLADTARGLYTGAIEGKVNSYTIDSVGVFAVNTTADLNHGRGGLALKGTIRARSSRLFNPGVREFLGGNLVASSQVAYGADGVIRFSRLRLAAPLVQVFDGRGCYGAGGVIAMTLNGRSARYGPLAVELNGTLDQPRAMVLAGSPGVGIGLANLRAEIISSAGGYRFAAKGQTDYGPLTADVTLLPGKRQVLRVNSGDLAGIAFAGKMESTAAGPYIGQLTANGRGVDGTVRLLPAGRFQEALVSLRASDTVLPGPAGLTIGGAIVDARVVLYDRPLVEADVQLAQTRIRELNLAAARAQVNYRDGRGQARFLAEGISGAPFRVAGNALLEPKLWRVSLDGRVRGLAFRTAGPARIVPGPAGYELLPSRIEFGQGSVRLAGTYGTGIRLESRLDRLDMAVLNAFVPGYGIGGKATGSLDFAQANPGSFPRADARLTIEGFSRTTAAVVSQPVDINVVGKLLPDGGQAQAVIRRRGTVIGRLNASLRPLGAGRGDWVSRVTAAPLAGGVRYNGPAETLWSFVGQPDQSLSGPVAVGADFSGRLDQPQLTGIIRGQGVSYENQTYGTRLTQMTLTGRFAGERLQIQTFTARAGAGTVAGQGQVSLSAADGYPLDLSFRLDNAALARSDALSSSATGQLRLQKTSADLALLSGELTLPETRFELVRQGAAEVPELTGVRFKPPRGRVRITGNEPAPPRGALFGGVRLDIALRAPNRLFVTGMGLDSEWNADLRVTGTSASPRVAGDINLVRGNLGFAGRQFDLQDGRLLFTGGALNDPQIVMNASEDIDDIAVSIAVRGRALNPQIAFTSNPSLPADEILSRILFGNSVGQLSPLQAVQLAASLNSLRATGGGLNPLGRLRAATGISRLRLLASDEKTGRGTAIAAGRYISNSIYIELITDARGFTATQMEISLSPTLSILSQAGGSGLTNLNLRYRKRY